MYLSWEESSGKTCSKGNKAWSWNKDVEKSIKTTKRRENKALSRILPLPRFCTSWSFNTMKLSNGGGLNTWADGHSEPREARDVHWSDGDGSSEWFRREEAACPHHGKFKTGKKTKRCERISSFYNVALGPLEIKDKQPQKTQQVLA